MKPPPLNLMQGTLDLLILNALALQPLHGLAISHRIVTAAGGVIEARSTPGRGTTFVVRLPAVGPIDPAVTGPRSSFDPTSASASELTKSGATPIDGERAAGVR